ncbi:Thioredoxin [Mycobacterium basiliense]|uniref:Thioredoxin n=1 Tax=Mycobacterium basiliense TaxID=2094119 RepID=A0A3S4BJK5_9MYCO|nr:thioredoxin family protein [Mycobacterium basiliense]VDM89651.1 Thioredoxin [Mycobacterium basiliense]
MSTVAIATSTIVAAIAAACGIGLALNRRSGVLRHVGSAGQRDSTNVGDLGLSTTGPTVVHFSAEWCGPCAAVRQVVDRVCAELPEVAHVEIDLDANPAAAKGLSVLSLPTTFIFDADGRQRYRTAGVPKAADLRTALVPLLA